MLNMRSTSRKRAVAISKDGGKTFGNITFDDSLIDPICEASIATIQNSQNP